MWFTGPGATATPAIREDGGIEINTALTYSEREPRHPKDSH